MPYRQRKDYTELGKAQIVPKRKKINWSAESKDVWRIQERVKKLAEEKHVLVTKRNALSLQNAILEARLLRLSKKRQEARVKGALTSYLENAITENKRMGLPTAGLEKARKNIGKIAGGVMTKGKSYRDMQKTDLYLAPTSVALGAFLDYTSKQSAVGNAFLGMGAVGGAIAANNLYTVRKDIRKQIEKNKSLRDKLADKALSK